MKKLIGFTAVLITLFLSTNAFAQSLTFESDKGTKYEAATVDLPGDAYTWRQAKAGCSEFEENGKKGGWFVPSLVDLENMYAELHLEGLGNFVNGDYWSSDKFGLFHACEIDMLNGQAHVRVRKNFPFRVRCVRAVQTI